MDRWFSIHTREWDSGGHLGLDPVNYNAMHEKYWCEVEYTDGTTEPLAANIIAENIMSQVDSEGHHYQVLTKVTDHNKDDSDIDKVDGFIN